MTSESKSKTLSIQDEIIQFTRRKDFKFVRELGAGACGRTVLLYDEIVDEYYVCKKFVPPSEVLRKQLFQNFLRETKILHQVHHDNVVRVFNYYLFPDDFAGYILMEYIEGTDIEDFLKRHPERINELFVQAVAGFRHLESNHVLHRDIRPQNLLVRNDGTLKIIDFGFGKTVHDETDFDKSVSLNWWCELPKEFSQRIYDFGTEVYFVGKLFDRIISENQISQFEYFELMTQMCQYDPAIRPKNFANVEYEAQRGKFFEIGFTENEKTEYREFADALSSHISEIDNQAKYHDDIDKLQTNLENLYRSFMLEETVPDPSTVVRCVLNGSYHYYTRIGLPVAAVGGFLHLLKSNSIEKKRIILLNLCSRLDAISRHESESDDDDLPF
ncbi:MAG: protein kinase family protein [Candidatus Zixiibacteriota bacterium]